MNHKTKRALKISSLLLCTTLMSACTQYKQYPREFKHETDAAVLTTFEINKDNAFLGFNSIEDTLNHGLTPDYTYMSTKSEIGMDTPSNNDLLMHAPAPIRYNNLTLTLQDLKNPETIQEIAIAGFLSDNAEEKPLNLLNTELTQFALGVETGENVIFLPIVMNSSFNFIISNRDYRNGCNMVGYNLDEGVASVIDLLPLWTDTNECVKAVLSKNYLIPLYTETSLLQDNNLYFDWAIHSYGENTKTVVAIQKTKLPQNNTKLKTLFSSLSSLEDETNYLVFYFDKTYSPVDILEHFTENDAPITFTNSKIYRKFTPDNIDQPFNSFEQYNTLIQEKENQ